MNPKVTVYVVSHNYGTFLEQAIESVLRQSFDDWELLLADDNSSDNSLEIMRLYRGDERVRILNGEGRGLIPLANRVLREARGEYIIRLDADDFLDDHALLVMSNFLDRNPDVAMVFPDYYLIDKAGIAFSNIRKESLAQVDHIQDTPPHGACTMIRRSVLDEIGGYDESISAQDGFYVWTRVKDGHKVRNINLPLFYYRQHGANLTGNIARISHARQEIKKMACDERIRCGKTSVVAVIPCRQNYDFTSAVWRERLGETSLLEIAIEKCLSTNLFSRVVVTADSRDVLPFFEKYGDDRLLFVERSREFTLRSRPIADTLESVSSALGLEDSSILVLCYPQAPFASTATLEEAVYTLYMHDADSAFTATPVDVPLYRRGSHGMVRLNPADMAVSDFNTVYKESRDVFALRVRNLKRGSISGSKSVCFSSPGDTQLYIDSFQDLALARAMAGQGGERS
ncbi:glycosyltransferase family 2 protein [Pseudodesulfovibrio tunisiensis]|uniref:glycosyltransferase family 2 protein n=1 Tax=Pseudodesulfovibrio tunisiensis TaxID=463192 RepID=UPI001FB464E2|nr:glycosyltransferase family 2 protein [Pseudodesulfovibrio tunisiensis]